MKHADEAPQPAPSRDLGEIPGLEFFAAPKTAGAPPVRLLLTTPARDGYAALEDYLGHKRIADQFGPTDFAVFAIHDQQHLFVVYNYDSTVFLRSRIFVSAKERDLTLANVRQNLPFNERYKIIEIPENRYAVALFDEWGKELARSQEYGSYLDAYLHTPEGWKEIGENYGVMY